MEITVNPKLVVRDADAAIAYYAQALDAHLTQRYTAGEAVVFAELKILGAPITLKEEDEYDPGPATLGKPGVLLEIATANPDALAEQMIAAGAQVVFPIADQPYGARGGRVRDPFGHEWLIQTPLESSPEEIQRSMDGMSSGD